MAALLSALFLQPVLDEPTPLRLVALGADVSWELDGLVVARTQDGQAATVLVDQGSHELWVTSQERNDWQAFARPEPVGHEGAAFVAGWSARHEAPADGDGGAGWFAPLALAGLGVALLAFPRWRTRKNGAADSEAEAPEQALPGHG